MVNNIKDSWYHPDGHPQWIYVKAYKKYKNK
jgi:hypothetical protein